MALRRKDQSLTRFLAYFKKPTKPAFHIYRAVLESFFLYVLRHIGGFFFS